MIARFHHSRRWVGVALSLALGVMAACGDDGGPVDLGTDAATDAFVAPLAHLGSTASYSPSGELSVERPPSAEGDLLVLFLSRTDDLLPMHLEGWSPVTGCFKSFNTQLLCLTEDECTEMDGDYCLTFGDEGEGRDLATMVFTRLVAAGEPASYGWSLRGLAPSWAIVSAIRGADEAVPVRATASRSLDSFPNSRFPSAEAQAGDLLLLAQSFDDAVAEDDFLPPSGMARFQWIAGADEAGHVFGGLLAESGPTGERETLGVGGENAKDLMLTVVIAGR